MIDFSLAPGPLGYAIISEVLGHEGGYVNDPDDRGKETIWGITKATAMEYGWEAPMRNMPRSVAIQIYFKMFWRDRFDKVAALGMPRLAYAMMDFGVNSGKGRPVEALQRSLNALNLNGQRWKDIAVDGDIGPATLAALAACQKALPGEAEELLTMCVNSIRLVFVTNLAERSPKQEKFMLGWLRRINAVEGATDA